MPSGTSPSTAPIEATFAGVIDGVAYVSGFPGLPNRRFPVEGVIGGVSTPAIGEKVLVAYADTGRLWIVQGGGPAPGSPMYEQAAEPVYQPLGTIWVDTDASPQRDPLPIVTSLPSGAQDGTEVYFQNAAMAAAGILWHFRYRSNGGTNKWEFLGGPPLWSRQSASHSAFSTAGVTTFATINNWSPVVVPLSGVYRTHMWEDFQPSSSATTVWAVRIGLDRGDGSIQLQTQTNEAGGADILSSIGVTEPLALTAGWNLVPKAGCAQSIHIGLLRLGYLEILPVAVSG